MNSAMVSLNKSWMSSMLPIPLDGMVLEGEAMVNQAALTGESIPIRKTTGATVYAGTVVEEGECVLVAKAEGSANRYAALSCILFML